MSRRPARRAARAAARALPSLGLLAVAACHRHGAAAAPPTPADASRGARPAGIPPASGPTATLFALRYVDVVRGGGAPAEPGQVYAVQYTGYLRDGTRFDSSRDRGEPLRFEQGKRRVIAGWDLGFDGMRVGGRRRLFIPYQLAYGETGKGPIPPRADLIFDLELVGVSPATPAAPARSR